MTNNSISTLVIGASEQTDRYANMAVRSLLNHGYDVIALGAKSGQINGVEILTNKEAVQGNIDTVTLYLNPSRQVDYYDFIIALNPRRVIFNPGTENAAFMQLLTEAGILPIEACTLVMLSTGQY